jgi:hypothetical protein
MKTLTAHCVNGSVDKKRAACETGNNYSTFRGIMITILNNKTG